MLFCFNPRANPRIKEIQQFLFFKRCFYKFFSTLLVFHSYLELFINHNHTGRSISEFKNYLTVNHGLHDVDKKFGIQKFTVEISIHRCKKPGRRNPQFPNGRVFACSDGFLLSSFRFPANNKQGKLWRSVCVQGCPNFNTWGYGLRSKHFEGSRLYSKIILGL